MLTIELEGTQFLSPVTLHLEHSLASLSKWESVYEVPFYSKKEWTSEETASYIVQMIIDPFPPANVAARLSPQNVDDVNKYINSKQSATWFNELAGPDGETETTTITTELIYFWMIQFKIHWSCENWHINRLMTLIKICGIKNSPPKKVAPNDRAAQIRELNAKRLKEMGTTG